MKFLLPYHFIHFVHRYLSLASALLIVNLLNAQPDLVVMQDVIQNTLVYEQRNFSDQCLLNEKCVGGLGRREILRFTTEIRNIGTTDYFIGRTPTDPLATSTQFIWDECHRHWHFKAYAKYGLYDATGKELPTSFKNGFCVEDLGKFVPSGVPKYTCDNQGISVGCYDKYDLNLPCQWIDITGLVSGVYKLVVDVNWLKQKDNNGRDELNYTNNTATVCFQIARNGASATVTKMNCDTNIGGGTVPPSTTGVVTVYETQDYAGRVLSINQGTYNAANLGALNLNISALTVMNGYQVRACRADGYCRTFTANTPFVGSDMDNQIVSLEVSARSTISPTCTLAFTTSTIAASCASNDGQATFTISGGTPPYQAALDAGTTFSSTFTFGGLTSGAHTATIKDNAGCIVTQSFVVAKNCTVINCNNVIVSITPTAATCAGNDGILDKLILGGTPPYQFSIDGKTPQAAPSFSGLSVGAHYVIVKDNVGCNVRKDFTIAQDCVPVCAITAVVQHTNVTCAGNDGKATITVSNGTAPYTYIIDGNISQANNSFALLPEGNHTVVVTDAKGCTKSVAFTIGKSCTTAICNVTATAQVTPATCIGNDGKTTLTASGGIAPYQYAIAGTTWQTSNIFTGLTNKSYDFEVKDSKGCNILVPVSVTKNCAPCALTVSNQVTAATCVGNDGKIILTASGGTAPYKYTLTGVSAQRSNIFSGLTEKTYQILVSDSKGCNVVTNATVSKACTGFDPNKCYRFVFTHSGQVLDTRNSSDRTVQQYTWSNAASQIWKIQNVSDDDYYKIVNASTQRALAVESSSLSNTAEILHRTYHGTRNQQWKIIATDTNIYKIVNRNSGKVTDIPGTNVTTNGIVLQQNTDSNQADQRFRIEEVTCSVVREDAGEVTQVTIFPNPSKKEVNIRMDEAFAERLSGIKIYDVLGNAILQTDTRSQEISFEILKDGFYIVALSSKNGSIITRKLIIANKEE